MESRQIKALAVIREIHKHQKEFDDKVYLELLFKAAENRQPLNEWLKSCEGTKAKNLADRKITTNTLVMAKKLAKQLDILFMNRNI